MKPEDEIKKLPPKLDLTEVKALQSRLDAYFKTWTEWEKQRESWLITASRSMALGDLAWLWEQGLRLAAARPDLAAETLHFLDELTHNSGTSQRRAEWWGDVDEEKLDEADALRRLGFNLLEARFKALGVGWLR